MVVIDCGPGRRWASYQLFCIYYTGIWGESQILMSGEIRETLPRGRWGGLVGFDFGLREEGLILEFVRKKYQGPRFSGKKWEFSVKLTPYDRITRSRDRIHPRQYVQKPLKKNLIFCAKFFKKSVDKSI